MYSFVANSIAPGMAGGLAISENSFFVRGMSWYTRAQYRCARNDNAIVREAHEKLCLIEDGAARGKGRAVVQQKLFGEPDDGMFVTVGEKKYPKIILGGDKFLNYWGPQRNAELSTVGGVLAMMEKAYDLGVRGFDISIGQHVIDAFHQLQKIHHDAIGIGNPNWRCGIKIGDKHIDDFRDRIGVMLVRRCYSTRQRENVRHMAVSRGARWYLPGVNDRVAELTDEEISSIRLDEQLYRKNLEQLVEVADFVLVGTDYADWLIPMGKQSVLSRMVSIVKDYDRTPLSISHLASVTLPVLDQMGVAGHWVYVNKQHQLMDQEAAHWAITNARNPVTAFRVLAGGILLGDMRGAFEYLKQLGIESVVIGAESKDQLEQTIPMIREVMGIKTGGVR